ncbi:DUF3558 family protein [Amycolatopsis sp. FDAARGOS 1241]|uniref:DUF3558 family protein n=1 Tax=Amycolatopsis sp. FDAARGOS 1241 TaxID=2778070 RepID=UPI00194EF8C4|nr:DUF3558 family protein [Amycolatopsis sp. FDAARGOS 1241]QRP45871.1 DUF3558 family protein [Amycolatopsis sp. FDAARGOS 1241]
MTGFRGVRAAAAFAAAVLLLAGCTVRVGGAAQPVPGQGPVKRVVDACSLLDQQQVTALGYREPGKASKASEKQQTPAACLWNSADDTETLAILGVGWSVDLSQDDYLQGALAKSQPEQIGGFTWTRYAGFIAGSCDLYTTLGPKSFAYVSVDYPDDAKSCQLAKQAVPQVAAHLPGGQPAPPITPSSSAAPPTGPLSNLDPCTLLKPDQATSLKMAAQGDKQNSTSVPDSVFCLWPDTDGTRGQKPFEVWLGPSTPMTKWPGMDVPPTSTLDANGRHWSLFPNFNESGVNCAAGLAVTPTSSIQLVSGFLDDTSKSCDAIKVGIPLVSANLPS